MFYFVSCARKIALFLNIFEKFYTAVKYQNRWLFVISLTRIKLIKIEKTKFSFSADISFVFCILNQEQVNITRKKIVN